MIHRLLRTSPGPERETSFPIPAAPGLVRKAVPREEECRPLVSARFRRETYPGMGLKKAPETAPVLQSQDRHENQDERSASLATRSGSAQAHRIPVLQNQNSPEHQKEAPGGRLIRSGSPRDQRLLGVFF